MAWSRRTAFERADSALATLLAAATGPLTDLTESNPTRAGLSQPAWIARLGAPEGAHYAPTALGDEVARAAVVRYYARRGVAVDAAHIVLSASTSEAYGWLFKLLCDPGDEVLAPRPSYPLFPYLAALEAVTLVDYPLRREDDWRIDGAALSAAITERTRALLVVHPHNPTGATLAADDAMMLAELGRAHDLALVVDEVFADYPHGGVPVSSFADFGTRHGVTCFALSGLSKVALLPQVKLGWIAVSGPAHAEALARLEVIADSYLSVATPIQRALPGILDEVDDVQAEVRARLLANLSCIDAVTKNTPVRRAPSAAGWYAVLEIPRVMSDDAWLAALIERERIIVHPGYFFDMDDGNVVVSLLVEPAVFAPAIARAVALWSAC
jgi:hypothetical protein